MSTRRMWRRRREASSECCWLWVVMMRSNGCATRRVVCVVGCGLSQDAAHVRVVMATGVQSRLGSWFYVRVGYDLRH